MKRLCAAVIVTVTLCLFVLLVTREPASTATRSQVPRDEQAAPIGPGPRTAVEPVDRSADVKWHDHLELDNGAHQHDAYRDGITSETSTPPTNTTTTSARS